MYWCIHMLWSVDRCAIKTLILRFFCISTTWGGPGHVAMALTPAPKVTFCTLEQEEMLEWPLTLGAGRLLNVPLLLVAELLDFKVPSEPGHGFRNSGPVDWGQKMLDMWEGTCPSGSGDLDNHEDPWVPETATFQRSEATAGTTEPDQDPISISASFGLEAEPSTPAAEAGRLHQFNNLEAFKVRMKQITNLWC